MRVFEHLKKEREKERDNVHTVIWKLELDLRKFTRHASHRFLLLAAGTNYEDFNFVCKQKRKKVLFKVATNRSAALCVCATGIVFKICCKCKSTRQIAKRFVELLTSWFRTWLVKTLQKLFSISAVGSKVGIFRARKQECVYRTCISVCVRAHIPSIFFFYRVVLNQ